MSDYDTIEELMADPEIKDAVLQWASAMLLWENDPRLHLKSHQNLIERLEYLLARAKSRRQTVREEAALFI